MAVLAHGAGLVLIYLTAFATGAGSALRDTAAVTCVPRLVEPADLDRVNGRVIAGQIVGNELAGPAAGGWLFGLAAVLPFAVNAGTLGIAVLLLLTLPSVFQPVPVEPARRDRVSPLATLRRDLGEGARWLWQHPSIRDVTIGAGVVSAMDAAWFAVLVLYVIQILHQKPGAYGLLLAVAALGGIAAWALFNLTAVTMRQRLVPAALLGRVSSLYGAVGAGAEVLGAIGGGALAAAAGSAPPCSPGPSPSLA